MLLCAACLARLAPPVWHGCRRCGHQLPETVRIDSDHCPFCPKTPLRFDAVIPLGSYHAGLREAVLRMKRPAHDALSAAIGRLLAARRREELAAISADVIVPIPMFWRRRLRRGKNCPELLGNCLAKSLGVPTRRGVLVRLRNTVPQAGLPPSRRFENVRGAFCVRRPEAVRDARVLLVDDVLTTGATCQRGRQDTQAGGGGNGRRGRCGPRRGACPNSRNSH